MKRFLSLFLLTALVLTLFAGCGGSGKTKPVEGGMKIATTTADFGAYSDKHTELIDYLHQAGFRYIDLSFYSLESMDPFMEDDWQEYAQQLKKHVADKKMEFVQAHSFGGNAFKDQQTYDKIVKYTIRSIEACAILGIPQIVVHAPYESHMTEEEFFKKALDFYEEFFPVMEKTGVKVLIENSAEKIVGCDTYFYTGATMRKFLEYANNPLLGACWDTGHANIQGSQYFDIIDLGEYLWGIHVADNQGEEDEHLMPYVGTMSIDEVMSALVKIGYKGAFTFECENTLNTGNTWPNPRATYKDSLKAYMPSLELKLEMEKVLLQIGEHILTKYEIPIG